MTIAAAYTSNASNASVHSNGSNSGMDIDADADGDGDADGDPDDAEVEGDLAALVDQAGPSPTRPSSGSRQHRNNNSNHIRNDDVDIATLAGVDDDDPDDYDSPATTNALRRQQAARVSGGPAKASVGEVTSGPESADGDAELDLLEAVDAAEANSSTSS
ncbi:hypothetical protein BDP27DRAFT_986704 [Rhodocollybia butyracea]|uniref:Uncharacterized protein n=1 Tax=Rhodocollybia butyracea TaxID=206335 RepID=A0A9P5U6E8_9AGAR|nr:hypothetical protein BDP27DRAFT_986704 [Rhodocollybia butyracea]